MIYMAPDGLIGFNPGTLFRTSNANVAFSFFVVNDDDDRSLK